MEEVQQPVLMPVYRDPELVDIIAKIVDLWTPYLVAGILQILQRTTDLRPMCRDLRSDVVQCRLFPQKPSYRTRADRPSLVQYSV